MTSLGNDEFARRSEVIVIDNHSVDGTVEAIAAHHPWVELVASPANLGFARANNVGLARAGGDYVLLLNPDTVVPRFALQAAVAAAQARPSVGILGVKLVQPDGALDHACKRGLPSPATAFYYFCGLATLFPTSPRFAHYVAGHVADDEIAYVEAVNGAFMLVRREALLAVGLLDEDFWMYMEDLDWCHRFRDKGWDVLYWPEVTVTHVKGGSAGRIRKWQSNYAFHKSMLRYFAKHQAHNHSVLTVLAVRAGIIMRLGLTAAISGVRRRILPPTRTGTV